MEDDSHIVVTPEVAQRLIVEAGDVIRAELDTRNNRDFAGMIRRGAGIAARDAI